ncbi:hypothetical protein ACLIA0_02870 [Bacillaceae bacterium W0354]
MSWKAVEMQVALPRTHEVGQLQDQMQQRGQLLQDQLAQSQLRQEQLNRKTVIQTNEKDDVKLSADDQEGSNHNQDSHNQQEKNPSNKKNVTVKHPYLGQVIDYSG